MEDTIITKRIVYVDHPTKENHVISYHCYKSTRGAVYRIVLDMANLTYGIRNENTKIFIKKGSSTCPTVLRRMARKALISLGVKQNKEIRNRNFGKIPKGMTKAEYFKSLPSKEDGNLSHITTDKGECND